MKTSRKTPKWLVDKMWDIVNLHIYPFTGNSTLKVLEPSAGVGDLILYKLSNLLFKFTCVELNKEKIDELNKICHNNIHGDFMKLNFEEKFDIIIAAPPFNNNVDVEHIQKMYTLLADDGIIVTLTSPYWMTNNEPHQIAFREWLKDKNQTFEMLPDMTFVEKGKTVPTGILIIKK